jgi:ABC-2 type transport system permease protein
VNKLLTIAQNDLRVVFKEKSIWINLVFLPTVLIIIVGLANGAGGSNIPRTTVDVYDHDQSSLSTQFLDSLRELNPNLILCPMDNDPDNRCKLTDKSLDIPASQKRVEENIISAIIEIPHGFEEMLFRGEPTELIYRSDEDITQQSVLFQTVQAATSRISGASVAGRVSAYALSQADIANINTNENLASIFYQTANTMWQNPPVRVNYRLAGSIEAGGGVSGFNQSVPGMGSMYVMFTVLAGATALILERKQWTLQRLVMMPIKRWQILGGKLTARFILGMIQYAVAFGVGMVLGVRFWNNIIGILALMIAFSLCMTALAFLVATVVKTDAQAASITLLLALMIAPLGGAWWPLEIVPDFMKVAAFATPMGWAMHGYNQLMIYGGDLTDIVLPVLVLLVASAVMFGIAVIRFKYE